MIRRTWRSQLPRTGSVCLFCRGRLTGAERPEHIVPDAMGGWLTTYDVCNPCNHRFGGQVDSVASNGLFALLREEAGLPVSVAPDLDPIDEEMRKFGPWRPDRDGTVRWSRDVVEDAGGIDIIADTIELARDKLAEKNARRRKNGLPEYHPQFEEMLVEPDPKLYLTGASDREMKLSRAKLPRLGAKVAIEYIAKVAGPDVALSNSLNAIRSYASHAEPEVVIGLRHIGRSVYWLPGTRRLQAIIGDAEEDREARAIVAALDAKESDTWEPPATFPRLRHLYHRLFIDLYGGEPWFSLILFGWVRLDVLLPGGLRLPWGTYHRKGFLPSRESNGWR